MKNLLFLFIFPVLLSAQEKYPPQDYLQKYLNTLPSSMQIDAPQEIALREFWNTFLKDRLIAIGEAAIRGITKGSEECEYYKTEYRLSYEFYKEQARLNNTCN